MKHAATYLVIVLLMANVATGATITVRKDGTGDYMVIQQALDVAADGDTVLIGPGEYLEHAPVRYPGWTFDIETYAHVNADDLTIIGAGSNQTFIGPPTYSGNAGTVSPRGIGYAKGGDLHISDVCVRNCYNGMWITGILFMERSEMNDHYVAVDWEPTGSGGWIKNSTFDVTTPFNPLSFSIGYSSLGSDILIDDCQFSHSMGIVRDVAGMTFSNCEFTDHKVAIQIYNDSQVAFQNSRFANIELVAIQITLGAGAVCEIVDSVVQGGLSTLMPNATGRFIVERSRLEGGSVAILDASIHGAGACSISNCDLIKGSGPAVLCGTGPTPVVHDLRNNYWGTTSEADIQAWIVDHSDNPNLAATVLYSPFAGQSVPTESTTWGELKALWR